MASLDKMIDSVLDRNSAQRIESLVIANDLTQKKLFGIRQGVEFYCNQDDPQRSRNRFLQRQIKRNKVDLWLDRLWDLLLCKGEICFYLRPVGKEYQFYWYDKDQFRAYYDAQGKLTEVCIIYSYRVRQQMAGMTDTRWVRLRIKADTIEESDLEAKPEFDYDQATIGLGSTKTYANSQGFIPCVIAQNYVVAPGEQGASEYHWLGHQIETHDRMLRGIRKNIEYFGNPTLVATRSKRELVEAGIDDNSTLSSANGVNTRYSNQYATSNGWRSSSSGSRRDPLDPWGDEDYVHVRRVVGGVQSNEQFGYVSPDPVSGDHNLYAREYRENLHTALGGVDPLGVSAGATAFEIKSLFGRTAATALKKANHLYTHGLCQLFEMAIALEEKVFVQSFAAALELPLDAPYEQLEGIVQQALAANQIPKDWQPVGLMPMGDRTVSWRWLGPVFEDSPIDLQQKSIVVRNLEEVGVETMHALKFLFDNKTEQEITQMLTGYPFREMRETHNALGQAVQIYSQLLATPDINNPNVPLGATVNNLPVIAATIEHLMKRMDYARQLYPSDGDGPDSFTPAPSSGVDPRDAANTWLGGNPPGSTNAIVSSGQQLQPNGLPPGPTAGVQPGISDPGRSGYGAAAPANGASSAVSWYDLPASSPAAAAGLPPSTILASLLSALQQPPPISTGAVPPGPTAGVPPAVSASVPPGSYPAGGPGASLYVGQGNFAPEYASAPPVPGSIVNTYPSPGATNVAAALSNGQPSPYGGYGGQSNQLPPDLANSPGLLAQLFPTVAAALGAISNQRPTGKRQRQSNQR